MIITENIIDYKDFKWIVKASFPERIGKTTGYDFDELKNKYGGDIILKKSGKLLICQIIEDIEYEYISESDESD